MQGTADAYPFPTLAPPLRFATALAAVFAVCWAAGDMVDDGSEFQQRGAAVRTAESVAEA
jgi:hypothetical protein